MQIESFKTKTGKFEVNNYGNGWAYEVIDTNTGASLWMQDDDAKELEVFTANFKFENILADYVEGLTGEKQNNFEIYPRF